VLFVSTPLHPFTPGRSSRGFTEPTAPNPSHTRRHFPRAQANATLSELSPTIKRPARNP
jgi:hypothetical protein